MEHAPMATDPSTCRVATRFLKSAGEPTQLDGMTRQKVVNLINDIMQPFTRGMHRDEYWLPVQGIWKALAKAGIEVVPTNNEYRHNDKGVPTSKVWFFTVTFLNERQRPTTVHGVITASGAGSVNAPLDVYDVVAYAN